MDAPRKMPNANFHRFPGLLTALCVSCLVISGCGGASGSAESSPAPALPVEIGKPQVAVALQTTAVVAVPVDYSPPVVTFALFDGSGLTSVPDPASASITVSANETLAVLTVKSLVDSSGKEVLASASLTGANSGTVTSAQLVAGTAYTLTVLVADTAGNQATYKVSFPTKGGTPAAYSAGPIPAPAPVVSTYTCLDTPDPVHAKCLAEPYPFKVFDIPAYLAGNYGANLADPAKTALLSCKTQAQCVADTAALSSFYEGKRLREAASAVVKLTLPTDETFTLRPYYSCTGTVIKNNLDASLYIVTAGHCLFTSGGYYYPSIRYGTYRSTGAPISATFHFENTPCAGTLDFAAFGPYTVNAFPVAYNYASASLAAPDPSRSYGDITDFALLKLAGSLPAGVTPVAVSSLALSSLEKAFTFSHPFGSTKSGGYFDGVASANAGLRNNAYQFAVVSLKRLVEHGSSGAPLFTYDPVLDRVLLKGMLSTASDPINNACSTGATAIYSRLDRHKDFLGQYVGAF